MGLSIGKSKNIDPPSATLINLKMNGRWGQHCRYFHAFKARLINKEDWCPVCQVNGPRVMSEVLSTCKNLKVKFVTNDLTNEQTIASLPGN